VSFWRRIFGRPGPTPEEEPAEEPRSPALPLPDEDYLATLVAAVAERRRVEDVASPAFFAAIDALVAGGHSMLAAQWLEKFSAATPPGDARETVLLRAAQVRAERGESAEAVPHWIALSASPRHAAIAHFALGEHHRNEGDLRAALRHFESVLARDVAYPNARVRVDALRHRLGAAAPAAAALDDTLAGPDGRAAAGARYHLVRELGRGATGAVYLARDAQLERDVAVKLLHPHLAAASRREAVARFFDEARLTAALRHPNIVAILDLDERGRRLVMELCSGGTLRGRLERGPLPLRTALERHVELISALAAAHSRGVIHRDLKPANLLFRRDPDAGGELVLCDFGIAHLAVAGPAPAEGTLLYMSPAQRRGESANPADDLYSAALILREIVTGVRPKLGALSTSSLAYGSAPLPPGTPPEVASHLERLLAGPATEEALAGARALLDLAASGSEPARFDTERSRLFPSEPP